jgi:hypothetical protein
MAKSTIYLRDCKYLISLVPLAGSNQHDVATTDFSKGLAEAAD